MRRAAFDRFLGWIFIGGMAIVLVAMVLMMAWGWDVYTITWMTIITGTVVGMTAGMTVMIRSMIENGTDGSSSA